MTNLWEEAPIIEPAPEWESAPIISAPSAPKHSRGMTPQEFTGELEDLKDKAIQGLAGMKEGVEPVQKESFGKGVARGALEQLQKRETSVAAGGMAGGGAGMLLGGPLGMIIGGGIGAAAGSAGYDVTKSVKAMIQGKPEEVVGPMEQFETMGKEAAMDIGFSMAGALAQPIKWSRALLAKASGLSSEASQALQQTAKRLGIGLGAVDVGGGLPKAFAKTLGVFPWTGTPMRKAQVQKIADTQTVINRTLNAFGPNYATSQAIGMDMVAAARGTREEFRRTSSALYTAFEDAVKAAPRQDIIPTASTKEYAGQLLEEIKRGKIMLTTGEPLQPAMRQETLDYLTSLQKLPELITPDQYRRLTSQEIPDLIGKHLKDGVDIRQLTKMKAALEIDFANIRVDLLPEGEGIAVKSALDTANKFYTKGIAQFQTKAAKAFERVDAKIFKAGAEQPGSLNADEIYNVAVNLKSPKQIQDLTALVGQGNMKKAAAHHFETAVVGATESIELMGREISFVDPIKLEKALGFTGASREKLVGIREFYRTAGVNLNDVQDLISVMKQVESIGNPAEFVRRRLILSGITGAGAAAGIGGGTLMSGVPGGMITAGSLTLLSRHMSKIFSSPVKLKQLTIAMDEAAKASLRMAMLGKLTKALVDEEGD